MVGRPTEYTKEIIDTICQLVEGGENIDRICLKEGFPRKNTVYRWLRLHSEFSDDYERARAARAYARADRIDKYKRQVLRNEITPEAARVAIDVEKWQAGKENKKKFGDTNKLEVSTPPGESLEINVTSARSTVESRIAGAASRIGAQSDNGQPDGSATPGTPI